MQYEMVIGLEVHAQLKTASKAFSPCSTNFKGFPNTNTIPVCLGLPGALPVPNENLLAMALKACLAMHCSINQHTRFARKNYFYPDLSKGFQISQFDNPLGVHGHLDIAVGDATKRVGITRIHMEEDTGKSLHPAGEQVSLIDFNRCGIPLIEIVSEPDIRSESEASEYLKKLRSILRYLDICDGNMEEGNFRCDANVSIRPVGQEKLGTKAEVKNMNSFKHVEKALAYEFERQVAVLASGGRIVQETRLWDAAEGVTVSMRSKEGAHDYRYFPEPDIPPLAISKEAIAAIKKALPELPDEKIVRFQSQYGLPRYDSAVLCAEKELADYYEAAATKHDNYKSISNWIMTELLRVLKEEAKSIAQSRISAENLAALVAAIDSGKISGKMAKEIFEEMYTSGAAPDSIIAAKGLSQISDTSSLELIADAIIAENPGQVAEYLGGRDRLFGFFVGEAMKKTKGKANPQLINDLMKQKLELIRGR